MYFTNWTFHVDLPSQSWMHIEVYLSMTPPLFETSMENVKTENCKDISTYPWWDSIQYFMFIPPTENLTHFVREHI